MDEERPSETAAAAAFMRAIHQTLDDQPKILDDVISPRLIDAQSDFKTRLERWEELPGPLKLQLKAMVVMRGRFAEDCLAEAFHEGARQFVLLGAGLDTFAYRQPDWASSLRIFEVDHPATQQWKRRLLAEAKLALPDNGTFVPVNFEKISLARALSDSGFDSNVATFFSMLGVSQYLTEAALDETLKYVRSRPARSQIVFSFATSDAILDAADRAYASKAIERAAAIGEPILSRFLPDQLVRKLTAIGFSRVFHLTPEKANERYFQNRTDGLTAPIMEQVIRATV